MPNRPTKTPPWPRRAVLKLAALAASPRLALAAAGAAPALSRARAAARGPVAYDARVVTDTAGGLLHWMVSDSAVPPAAAILRAHNARKVSAAGPQRVSGQGLRPATRYWLHALHRARGRDSAILTTAGFTTAAAGPLTEAQVLDVYRDRRLTMPAWMTEGRRPKIVGTDPLPGGASYDRARNRITVPGGARVEDLSGWDFGATHTSVLVLGHVGRFRDNRMITPPVARADRPAVLRGKLRLDPCLVLDVQGGAAATIEHVSHCLFQAGGDGFGPGALVLGRARGEGGRWRHPRIDVMEYCAFLGMPNDGIKGAWAGTRRFLYLDPGFNIPEDAGPWAPGIYRAGDVVYNPGKFFLRVCARDGVTSRPDFSKKRSGTPDWRAYDPHSDLDTPYSTPPGKLAEWSGCFYNRRWDRRRYPSQNIGRGYVNGLRILPNSSRKPQPIGDVLVQYCIFPDDTAPPAKNEAVAVHRKSGLQTISNNWHEGELLRPAMLRYGNVRAAGNRAGWRWPGPAALSEVVAGRDGQRLEYSFGASAAGWMTLVIATAAQLPDAAIYRATEGGAVLAVAEIDCRAGQVGRGSVPMRLEPGQTVYAHGLYQSGGGNFTRAPTRTVTG